MANLFPARTWREKPNGLVLPYYGNPHTTGLIAAWHFFEGAGARLHDMVGVNHGILTGSSINWNGGGLEDRLAAQFSGDNGTDRFNLGSIAAGNPLMLTSTDFTILSKVRPRTPYGNVFPRIIDKSTAGSGTNGWAFYPRIDRLALAMTGAETTSPADSLTQADLENKWVALGATFRNSDNQVSFYANNFDSPIARGGTMRLLGTASGSTISTTTANAAIGNWNHTIDREWAGDISWIYIWDRLLTLDEINEVALAPFAMFQPYTSRTFFTMTAFTPATLQAHQITIAAG